MHPVTPRGCPYGRAEHLDAEDASVGGVLAWYSLIHTDPAHVPGVLTEFARVLTPGGSLALGFFEGSEVAPFDHAVTTASFWPLDVLARLVEAAGFTVTGRHARTDPGRGLTGRSSLAEHNLTPTDRAHSGQSCPPTPRRKFTQATPAPASAAAPTETHRPVRAFVAAW